MSEAMSRHWQMLRLIPREPRKIDTATLKSKLADRGFEIEQRSIQRDLNKLSAVFPLMRDERSKPYGWSWSKESPTFDMPGMDVHTALAFRLAEEHLGPLLPHATVEDLGPHFLQARHTLENSSALGAHTWATAVQVVPAGLPRIPAQVDRAVLELVQDGLLRRRRLALTYLPRGKATPKSYVANPLGLVYRDGSGYLVTNLWHYQDVLQLALHRIQSVEVLQDERTPPEGFDLDRYVASGAFGFQVSEAPVALVARLSESAAVRLYEAPLAADQALRPLDDGRVELRVTVPDTQALRVWLRGHGALCEVVAPASLRAELAADAARTAAMYGPT